MPGIDIVDETYVAVQPSHLAAQLTTDSLLAEWFPDLRFTVFMDRAEKGTRWSITGDLEGSMEVWLEPMAAGTLVHWFVRADPSSGREARRIRDRYVDTLNAGMFALKDSAEESAAGE